MTLWYTASHGAFETYPANENLRNLHAYVQLAKKVEKRLASREILLTALSKPSPYAPK